LPDPKYGSRLVAKFVNIMMIRGKKSTAERIMYDALVSIEDRSKQDALKMFKSAIDNVKPAVEVKSRRGRWCADCVPVGGAPGPADVARHALGHRRGAPAGGAEHGGEAGRRVARRRQQPWHRGEEARRHAQDGGGQQGVRALSLVARPTNEEGGAA